MNGLLNVLKPPAMTSSDVVCDIRRLFGEKRVGHTGTLDPGAAGVLPVCVGRATKLADYIMRGDKEYIAEMTCGAQTDTLDSYGKVTRTAPADVSRDAMESLLPAFIGVQWQSPPAYSAVKQGGQPLYKLARQGIAVEKPPRRTEVYDIGVLAGSRGRFLLRIRCSKGTYVRTLVSDVAKALNTIAYTSFLLRTRSCGFSIENAVTLQEIAAQGEKLLIPPEKAVGFLPRVCLQDHLYDVVMSGAPISLQKAGIAIKPDTDCAVFCRGALIGIGKQTGGILKIAARLKID